MTNRGVLNGLGAGTWTKFTPTLICPGGTDPTFGQGSTAPLAKYVVLPNGDILAQYQYTWWADSTAGTGTYYAWKLPFAAKRPVPGSDSYIPIGLGQGYKVNFSSGPSPQVDMQAMLAPVSDANMVARDDPDWYFVALLPHVLDWGTDTIGSTANTKVVSHNIGFAFDAADIQLDITAGSRTTAAAGSLSHISVSNITSTQFTVTAHDTASGTVPFSYKIRTDAMPSGSYASFASPTQPMAIGLLSSYIFFTIKYAPRR